VVAEVGLEPRQRLAPELRQPLGRGVLRAAHRRGRAREELERVGPRRERDRVACLLEARLGGERGEEIPPEVAEERVRRRERRLGEGRAEVEDGGARPLADGGLDPRRDLVRDRDRAPVELLLEVERPVRGEGERAHAFRLPRARLSSLSP